MRHGPIQLIALFTALGLGTASASPDDIWMSGGNVVEIPLDESSMKVNVGYPGPRISNVCGIGLRLSGAHITNLEGALHSALVVHGWSPDHALKPKPNTDVDFTIGGWGTYVWSGTIETAGGASFGALLAKLGAPDARLMLVTLSCSEAERKAHPMP